MRTTVLALALTALCLQPLLAHAQSERGDAQEIHARVTTDALVYAPGDVVTIRVFAMNASRETRTLTFSRDGLKADYLIDDAYQWSANKMFVTIGGSVTLLPGEEKLLGEFKHTPNDHTLEPGTHVVTGIVVDYARASVRFEVGPTTQDPIYSVRAEATPRVAAGAPVELAATVTNLTNTEQTFIVDGCPTMFALDGVYTPWIGCVEYAKPVTLEPGESVRFGPVEFPYLVHSQHDFPLSPGMHSAVLWVNGVGRAKVEFAVGGPPADVAMIGGGVVEYPRLTAAGNLLGDAWAELISSTDANTTDVPQPHYRTKLSEQGYFLFPEITPGTYFLAVHIGDRVVWYPNASTQDQAKVLGVRGGQYLPVRVGLPTDPPPPPETLMAGQVWEGEGFTNPGDPRPLAGASVIAIPLRQNATEPNADGTRPTPVPLGFRGQTDAEGNFNFPVPMGSYRVLAGYPASHAYNYWGDTGNHDEARVVSLTPSGPIPDIRITLQALEASPFSTISGQVSGFDPVTDGPPAPLADALVEALPVLHSTVADIAPVRGKTDESGHYRLEVPADTPYLIKVSAENYRPQFFELAEQIVDARIVDVAQAGAHENVNFILQPQGNLQPGVIVGTAFRLTDAACANDPEGCIEPAEGAVVTVTPAFPTFAPFFRRTVVGPDGHWKVGDLMTSPDGELAYYVMVEQRGMEPVYYPEGVPFEKAQPLPVFGDKPADAGRILLGRRVTSQFGFLSGHLTEPTGEPIADARIRVYLDPANPHGRVAQTRTDARGFWNVGNLPAERTVLVSADADGFIPAYYPDAWRWDQGERVLVGGPNTRMAPLEMSLQPNVGGGPYLQVGRVTGGPESGIPDDGVEPAAAPTLALRLLDQHANNLPGAFFYLSNALSASPVDIPMAGGASLENGVVLLTGLPEGTYYVFADRPGYDTKYFALEDGSTRTVTLNENSPAVLAEIHLTFPTPDTPPGDLAAGPIHNPLNAPNPFRPRTVIAFDLMESAPVTVQVFDYRGRLVRALVDQSTLNAGLQEIPWDGTNDDGRRVSSGVYFYRIRAGEYALSRKMVLLP